MKIALLTPTLYPYSGIDRVVLQHARELRDQGATVRIMTLDSHEKHSDIPIEVIGMPTSVLLQRVYRLFMVLDRRKIRAAAERLHDVDEIRSYFYPMNLIALEARRRFKIPYTYYNPGVPPLAAFESWVEKIYIAAFRMISNMSSKSADKVVSISRYLADVFEQETGTPSQVEYIPVDRHRFHSGLDRQQIRSELGLGNRPVLLYVGRLSPHKGIDLLVRAFEVIRADLPEVQLLLVGKPTFPAYAERLKRRSSKAVHWLSGVNDNDLPFYYAAADVYTTASLWEGYDLPLVEAQACGRPVVAFDLGPHRELINSSGRLVPSRDVTAFAVAVLSIIRTRPS